MRTTQAHGYINGALVIFAETEAVAADVTEQSKRFLVKKATAKPKHRQHNNEE